MTGADVGQLESKIERGTRPPPCKYQHFPMKFNELITFKTVKYDLLLQNLRKNNTELPEQKDSLTASEMDAVIALCAVMQDSTKYHTSDVTAAQYAAVVKTLAWPLKSTLPGLDLLRMLPFHPAAAKHIAEHARGM